MGPYEIMAAIGAGGMGEVYRATDSNLKRSVAIKVLPASVAGDADRLARFQREAEVLASLNHPNIAAIYGLERTVDVTALVMELVEGQDLSAHIAQGAMPLADVLPIARQIADALEAAHDQGIIHRDLKPANIKVKADGTVKVLDFGLAKAADMASSGGDAANSPTLTARATQMGMILGTAAYMAPEQARGRVVDKRADIWAFGAVLYEMLTGRRAFEGDDTSSVLARLLERDPDWTALAPETPIVIRRLLTRCLTKDPKARLRDIGEARVAIDGLLSGKEPAAEVLGTPAGAAPKAAWRQLLPWGLTAVFAVAAASFYLRAPQTPAAPRLAYVGLDLPADVEFFSGPTLSADGSKVAFIGVRLGTRQVYVRSLDNPEVRPVPGTETAATVAISPDGSTLAFITNDTRLKRVVLATGIIEPLADGASIYSLPAWTSDGAIVFSRVTRLVVRPRDGEERELAKVDAAAGETSLNWPVVVAGNGMVLFVSGRKGPSSTRWRLEAVPTGGGSRHLVLDGAAQAVFASADRLVFVRGDTLFVAPFAAARAEVTGAAVRLGETPAYASIGGVAAAIAESGALLMAPASISDSHLTLVSMTGTERPIQSAVRGFLNPRVSPDGGLIAFSESGTIWTLDPARNTFTRVSEGVEPTVGFPCWSPDGRRIYFRSADGIRYRRADGEGATVLLPNTGVADYPSSFSPDGSVLVLLRLAPETGGDLYTMPANGGELKPLLVTPAYEGGAQVSPDGKWLTYVSNESGRMEVLLRPFGAPGQKWPVSSEGGTHALWSRDGRQIFYRSGQRLFAVDVTTTPEVHLSAPRTLFDKRFGFGQNITIPNYSLTNDGRDFVMVGEEPGGRHLNMVLNWLQSLDRTP
jgi:Tol biopolymer transport system component